MSDLDEKFAPVHAADVTDEKLLAGHLRLLATQVASLVDSIKTIVVNDREQGDILRDIRHQQSLLFDAMGRMDGRLDGLVDEVRHVRRDVDDLQKRVSDIEHVLMPPATVTKPRKRR